MKEIEKIELNFSSVKNIELRSYLILIFLFIIIFNFLKYDIAKHLLFAFVITIPLSRLSNKAIKERHSYAENAFQTARIYNLKKIIKLDKKCIPMHCIEKIRLDIAGRPSYNYWADKDDVQRGRMIYSTLFFELYDKEIIEVPVTKLYGLKKFVEILQEHNLPINIPNNYKEEVIQRAKTSPLTIIAIIVLVLFIIWIVTR